jgi:hypothetical protein
MLGPIEEETIAAATGDLPNRLAERLGRLDAASAVVSVARMESRADWADPRPTRHVPIQAMGGGLQRGAGEIAARSLRLPPAVEASLPAGLAFEAAC